MSEEKMHALHHFMWQLSNDMAANYKELQKGATEDPGTTGDQAEIHWANWLREWLPPTYKVVNKGQIINQYGEASGQIDVLVLKSFYPEKLHTNKRYLSVGVAAAFECKTTLKASHIEEATEAGVKIQKLYRHREGTPYKELHSPIVYGLLAHSHNWKGKNSTPEDNIIRKLSESDILHVSHPRQGLDLLCVADCGTWVLAKTLTYLGPESSLHKGFREAIHCGHLEHTPFRKNETLNFTPIGTFYANLMERLAWEDPTLRDIVDYYQATKIAGEGGGRLRRWPLEKLSDVVQKQIRGGRRLSSYVVSWDEWKDHFGIRMNG